MNGGSAIGTLGGTADTDIGLLGLPGRVGELTEGVDGSTESALSGDGGMCTSTSDQGVGWETSAPRQLKISGEPKP